MPTEEQTYREGIKAQLTRIETQVLKTNGRVNWLEKMMYMGLGAIALISVFMLPIVSAYIQAGKL